MPQAVSFPGRDLIGWTIGLRRIAVVAGFGTVLLQRFVGAAGASQEAILLVLLGVGAYNEVGRYALDRGAGERPTTVANAQIALDALALTTLLHFGGGLSSQGVLFFVVPFFVYGAVLGHCLSALLRGRAENGRALAAERGALLARYEHEAGRVQLLLDIAQRASATHSVPELLVAVCEATAAMGRVARVESFVWDPEQECLRLIAARGLVPGQLDANEIRYPGDLPIVARLRSGEVVDFDVVPSQAPSATCVPAQAQRAFAAPMLCHGSFEGALVVGYDTEAERAALVAVVQGIACQAALAVANVRTVERQQEEAEVSGTLLKLSRQLSACLATDRLWQLILEGGSEMLGLPWAVAARFDEREGTFALVGAHGLPEAVVESFREARFRLEDSPVLQELLSQREIVVADESHVRALVAPAGWQVGAWLVVPLFHGGWVAGVLAAGHFSRRRTFHHRQLRLAEGLGHHASIALQNARLVADLEAADRLKSEFVSTMSHELRTPLNVIIGYTEMLRDGAAGEITEEQRDLVQRLDARGRELLELVEATLQIGRFEAGRATVEIAPVESEDLLHALQASTVGLPRPPGVALEWDVPTESRERIMTDRSKLALVVRNLVSNALKFTSEGKVIVQVALHGDTLTIEVRDTGIGIEAEHLPFIFDMFRQVDGSTTRRHGGVGLGLYIVRQFVQRLGGTVEVESTPGRGSRFVVVLPGVVQARRWPRVRAA